MIQLDEKQAYDTHYNYIKCLSELSDRLKLSSFVSFSNKNAPLLDTKKNLISLTRTSLSDEYKIVQVDKDYSYASTSWLPVKSYYLIFNMLLTTDYLFKLQEQSFRLTHKKCIEYFTRRLRDKEIEFSEPIFNQVFDKSILRFRVPSGSNLSSRTTNENMYKMTIRKIAKYKEDDWKRQNNIISLRKLVDKNKYNEFLNKFEVSVFDFPYYMRIRANYRDFAFIEGVNTSDTANYFNKYFTFAINLVKAIEYLNRKIARQRQLSF